MSGGLERIITLKANYFADVLGYEVTILTSEQQDKPPYYQLSPKVHHTDLSVCFDKHGKQQSFWKKAMQYPFKYYKFKKRFKKFLYQNKPDITISTLRRELNFIHSIKDGSIKIGEFHVTRYAYHANAMSETGFLSKILKDYWSKSFVKNISKLSKFVLLTQEECLNWPELNNTIVINNPLPFFPDKVSDCNNKSVIAVGRYAYQKGFDMLIDAWGIVNKQHPDWNLFIYGDGEREPYKEQIKKLHLEGTCFLKQPVPDITSKYTENSIFVLSSRFEGFGMVIVEAMACGVPPVSFACPCGPKDIIKDKVDGLLAQKENIVDLADQICYLIRNDAARKEMGRHARINSERFKIENIGKQWENLFEALLKSKN